MRFLGHPVHDVRFSISLQSTIQHFLPDEKLHIKLCMNCAKSEVLFREVMGGGRGNVTFSGPGPLRPCRKGLSRPFGFLILSLNLDISVGYLGKGRK